MHCIHVLGRSQSVLYGYSKVMHAMHNQECGVALAPVPEASKLRSTIKGCGRSRGGPVKVAYQFNNAHTHAFKKPNKQCVDCKR